MPDEIQHKLWLIYEQLKDAEADSDKRLELLAQAREDLGRIINQVNRIVSPDLYGFLAEAGSKGGAAKTDAKAAAARANGAKGGRPPRKPVE